MFAKYEVQLDGGAKKTVEAHQLHKPGEAPPRPAPPRPAPAPATPSPPTPPPASSAGSDAARQPLFQPGRVVVLQGLEAAFQKSVNGKFALVRSFNPTTNKYKVIALPATGEQITVEARNMSTPVPAFAPGATALIRDETDADLNGRTCTVESFDDRRATYVVQVLGESRVIEAHKLEHQRTQPVPEARPVASGSATPASAVAQLQIVGVGGPLEGAACALTAVNGGPHWTVWLPTHRQTVHLPPDKLRFVDGVAVQVVGTERTDINGKTGPVVRYDTTSGRHIVAIDGAQYSIRTASLHVPVAAAVPSA